MYVGVKSKENPAGVATDATSCATQGCDPQGISTVHAYLRRHFPDCSLRDFHTPTTKTNPQPAVPSGENHIVGIRSPTAFYSIVLTRGFLQHPAADVDQRLREWNVAEALRVHRLLIMWTDSVSPA